MEELFAKLREYLQMEEEIPFAEFDTYYRAVVAEFMTNFKIYDQDTMIKATAVTTVVAANAIDRQKHKGPDAKKYKKIAEKMSFWAEAIALRLQKDFGLTKQQVDKEIDKLLADV